MTTIYLHIGMPKTGTTSLQKFLFYNREKLLEKGYLYPIAGTNITSNREPKGYSHNSLVRVLNQNTNQKDDWISRCGIWEECKKEIKAIKPEKVIISAEFFTGPGIYNQDIIAMTKKLLNDYDTKIVIYLRRQDEFLRSYYCYLIKFLIRTDIKKFILQWKYMADYYQTLELWENVFGLENIIVKVFEKKQMKNSNLFHDFLAAVHLDNEKIDLKSSHKIRENISIYSGKAIKLINLIDKVMQKIPFQVKKDRYESYFIRRLILNNTTSKLMSYLPTNFICTEELLSKQERINILNEFEESNGLIARKYLGREDGKLFYSSIDEL